MCSVADIALMVKTALYSVVLYCSPFEYFLSCGQNISAEAV